VIEVITLGGIIKLAGAYQRFLDATRLALRERAMSEEELSALTEKLRQRHGLDVKYNFDVSPGESAHDITVDRFGEGIGHHHDPERYGKSGRVQSAPLEELILHEYGHAMDHKADPSRYVHDNQNMESLLTGAGWLGLGSGIALPFALRKKKDEDKRTTGQKILTGGAAAGMAGGMGMGYAAGKIGLNTEHRANDFVRQFWTDELGDAAKVKQKEEASTLPKGIDTYKNVLRMNIISPLFSGAIGLGIGGGLVGLEKRRDRKLKENGV
jgi:hypothetical protein